jgi:hypothetical protein
LSSATPRTDGIGNRDTARAVGVEQPRSAECGVLLKGQRIKIVVVHASVEDVHAFEAARGARIDSVVVDEEVAALDEIDRHLVRKKRVLVVGRVENARRQQHDLGIGAVLRGDFAQMREQRSRVVIDRTDMIALEQLWVDLLDDLPIREHVRDAAWDAQVVLENQEATIRTANEIRPS